MYDIQQGRESGNKVRLHVHMDIILCASASHVCTKLYTAMYLLPTNVHVCMKAHDILC